MPPTSSTNPAAPPGQPQTPGPAANLMNSTGMNSTGVPNSPQTASAANHASNANNPAPSAHQRLFEATVAHYLAPILPFLKDPGVAEVMVNKFDEVYVEQSGQLIKTKAQFADEQAYNAAVNNILQYTGKAISQQTPLVDARLPDGSRVHVAKAPCARFGTVMSIRKFAKSVLDVDWLVHIGTMTQQAADYIQLAIRREQNMLVAGGTSTGKTSLLNALSAYIPDHERIVVIEDSAELQLQKSHVVSLEAKGPDRYGQNAVSIRDLFKSSLRLRPDRIIVGEVRSGEALDMIQAMTSGHGGSMGTLHADSPLDTLNRLETLCLMSQVQLPLHAIRSQIASAIDVIVQMNRHVGGARVVSHIAEVLPLSDDGNYQVRDLFTLQTTTTTTTTTTPAPAPAPTPTPATENEIAATDTNLQTQPDAADPATKVQLTWSGERSAIADIMRPQDQALITPALKPLIKGD